jgi:hypothetical protein
VQFSQARLVLYYKLTAGSLDVYNFAGLSNQAIKPTVNGLQYD